MSRSLRACVSTFVHKNESGVVGPIIIFILGMAVIGFLLIVMGPLVDGFINNYNTYSSTTGAYVTSGQTDAINVIALAWKMLPVIVVFMLVFAFVVDALRSNSGDV